MVVDDEVIVIPPENRLLIVVGESSTIEVPFEWRVIEVRNDASRQ
jgi:hypothetical protein